MVSQPHRSYVENHLHFLTTNIYAYDAEGRMVYERRYVVSELGVQCLGCRGRVLTARPRGTGVPPMSDDGNSARWGHRAYSVLTYPRDLAGHWTGVFDIRPSHNWAGWDVVSTEQAQQVAISESAMPCQADS